MRILLALLPLTLVLLAGCVVKEADDGDDGDEERTPGEPQVHEVGMHNAQYVPASITVPKGDTLRFAAHDTTHSAITTNGVYDAGDIPQGTSKDVLLNLAGTYTFRCHFHDGMEMRVTITE